MIRSLATCNSELEIFGVFTDCYLGIYSGRDHKYIYTTILRSAEPKEEPASDNTRRFKRTMIILCCIFPTDSNTFSARWISGSPAASVLLLVLILFGGSLYYFYRQKFLNETQKDFIHNFTHEFKTPVSVISLAADVLKNPAIIQKPEKLATYAGIVEYQAAYLQSQTEKLLNFAYTESRQLHFAKDKSEYARVGTRKL